MKHWNDYWKEVKCEPVLRNPPPNAYGGTYEEPLASMGMTSFLDPIKDKFVEGFRLLDYGCGAGILSNVLSERLKSYSYYGVETNSTFGHSRIELAKQYFSDPRNQFGIIDTDFDTFIENRIDAVILISIFTHLKIEDIYSTLDKLTEVFIHNPLASIVFSCFIDTERSVIIHQPQIWERYYHNSFITENDLISYCVDKGLKLSSHGTFEASSNNTHYVYKIEKL